MPGFRGLVRLARLADLGNGDEDRGGSPRVLVSPVIVVAVAGRDQPPRVADVTAFLGVVDQHVRRRLVRLAQPTAQHVVREVPAAAMYFFFKLGMMYSSCDVPWMFWTSVLVL